MRKGFILLLTVCLAAALVTGCGQENPVPGGSGGVSAGSGQSQSAPGAGTSSASSGAGDTAEENSLTSWLPSGVEQLMAETKDLPELRQAIIDYYKIPEEYWEQTKYYYNYVDLNSDGSEEILAVVIGPYTSGSGGNSTLLLIPYADMAVDTSFTLINTPIIVTKEALNGQKQGAKGLIVLRSGGGAEAEPVLLKNVDGEYMQVNDGQNVEDLASVEGTAILCNDLIADAESGNYLTLAGK